MNSLDFKLDYQMIKNNDNKGYPVIVVAAGNSTRMCGTNKQLITLCGVPAIIHTLLAFERSNFISNIVLVTKEEDILLLQNLAEKYLITKLSDVVAGGSNRQESVLNGLKAIKNTEHVLIHDGARPLISENVIARVCEQIGNADGVICGISVTDTIKKTQNGRVLSTVDRSDMISVQTPQAVKYDVYIDALNNCDYSQFTDDASVLENIGHTVIFVEGEKSNIKITTPEDIALAEFYLEKRGENECE
ncbi:MAG: 2-C-methyl-D-erythritol 4-phosphate cytidylyltransferase [Clostridia bacterium]|nr:2-C-methyl-D-erythritol 4-phosphate cytidylyltransferase [Clostridia bacterium]